MLATLSIRNIAVISEAEITLTKGLNVFTGETGAGKTILIGAINAVLGARVSKDIIRTGENAAVVRGVFTDLQPHTVALLESQGFFPQKGSLTIEREITQEAGKGYCKVNGRNVTVSTLRQLGSLLINIHGQQDNQQLLSTINHIDYVDSFGCLEELLAEYRSAYYRYTEIKKQLESLNMDESIKAQRLDMLTYQINEIANANLVDGEEEELDGQRKLIRNAERVTESLGGAQELLTGGEEQQGILEQLDELSGNLENAARYIEDFAGYSDKLQEFGYELEELSVTLRDYLENIDFDPRRLDQIERRLDLIYRLKKKYGASVAEILAHSERCQEELDTLSFSEERAAQLEQEMIDAENLAQELADELSQKRAAAAEAFVQKVEEELTFLDMPRVRLSLLARPKALSANGCDDMEFLISPNPGETPRPLAKIASGGEISRIMLAIKNVLSNNREGAETLIFDEVDAGVSGRAATKIGLKLGQVAQNRQVLCVTHLAPVAAFGSHHLFIHKEEENGRTFTKIDPLDRQGRMVELARITAGDNITPAALDAAAELLANSRQQLGD
ncbi:MAG: DNA repair protein RecN [Oscillospiraceae bacterium]|nr:DNA repair protein RecN [Oscillospiraceae bacterium]